MSLISDLIIASIQKNPGKLLRLEHLLLVWVDQDDNDDLKNMLEVAGLSIDEFRNCLRGFSSTTSLSDLLGDSINCTDLFKEVILSEHEVLTELRKAGFNLEEVKKYLGQEIEKAMDRYITKYSLLESYGRNLTKEAGQGLYEHLGGRQDTLNTIVTTLLKIEKNNVILVGEAGVGKTALVELLAHEMVNGNIVGIDASTEIIEISPASWMAGNIYVGSLQQAVKNVINAVLTSKNDVILFLDEFHTIIGAGRTHVSNIDIANQLKPILTDRRFRVIGSTTQDEYNTYLKQDKAFLRRFETIEVSPPDNLMAFTMCKAKAKKLSKEHGIDYHVAVLVRAIELTNKHIPEQHQPDKAIDLLDRVGIVAKQDGKESVELLDLYECLSEKLGVDISELLND